MQPKNGVAITAVLITHILFGLSFLFTRLVLAEASTLTLLSWRFAVAFVAMTVLRMAGALKINLRGRSLKPLLLIGLFHPLSYYVFETLGIGLTSASESGVVIAIIPIVSMLLAIPFLREYPTRMQAVSIVGSVVGVVVVVLGSDNTMLLNPLGYACLFGAVICAAFYYITSRRAEGYTSAEKTYVMMGMGAAGYTAAALVEHLAGGTVVRWLTLPFRSTNFLIALVYLGIVTSILGTTLHNYSIGRLGVNRAAAFSSITTVVTIVAGVLFLHESFTLRQVVGTVLIVAGVTGTNRQPRRPHDGQLTAQEASGKS